MARSNSVFFLDLHCMAVWMLYWKKWFSPSLLVVISYLSSILSAHDRPYFEEMDRIDVPNAVHFTHFKPTPDGRYVLVTSYSDDAVKSSINGYRLLLDEDRIDKIPVISICCDGFNDPFAGPATIEVAGKSNNMGSIVYTYSATRQARDVVMPLVSGYQIDADGSVTTQGYAPIPSEGFPVYAEAWGTSAIDVQQNFIFALTDRGIAVIDISANGSLNYTGQLIDLSDKDKQPGSPATMTYIPSLQRLFVGLDCVDEKEPCEENTFLLVYSIGKNDQYKNASLYYEQFNNNNSYHFVITSLSQSHGTKPMVVMGLAASPDDEDVFSKKQKEVGIAGVLLIDPVTLKTVINGQVLMASDLEFSKSDDRLYASHFITNQSGIGITAYDVANNLSLQLISGSTLNTGMNHYALELTPDGCHLLATAGGWGNHINGQGHLILYRINDDTLNCTAPPTSNNLILVISIPSAVAAIMGLSIVSILSCFLAKKCGPKKGYTPIND